MGQDPDCPAGRSALAGTLILLAGAATVERDYRRLLIAVACAAATADVYLLLALLPRSYGLGDAKLGLLTGACIGWYGARTTAIGTLAAILLAGLVATIIVCSPTRQRHHDLAHGPFMLTGAPTAILLAAG